MHAEEVPKCIVRSKATNGNPTGYVEWVPEREMLAYCFKSTKQLNGCMRVKHECTQGMQLI